MTPHRALAWVWVAAAAGLLHAGFSAYWAAGGGLLLDTVGEWAVELRDSAPGAAAAGLGAIALLKAIAAVLPVAVAYGRIPRPAVWRVLSWLGAVGLVLYGGANTVISNMVLAGVLGSGDHNRAAMVGHAWLWDPLFLVWGGSLLIHLWRSRRGRADASAAALPPR